MVSDSDPLTIKHSASFQTAQGPVMALNGYLDELDVSVEVRNGRSHSDGNDGEVEVHLTDHVGAINRYNLDESIRVVAANNVEDIVLLAGEELADLWADHGPDAFAEFERQVGHPPRIPWGPWSERWLEALGVSMDRLDSVTSNDPQFVANKAENGEMDGAFSSLPGPTELDHLGVPFEQVAWIGDTLTAQPDGVTVMSESLWKDRPELARAILERHVRATEFIAEEPEEAADILADTAGEHLSREIARDAIDHRTANFVTDPRPIVERTQVVIETMYGGTQWETFPAEELFEPSLYEDVAGG